MRKFNKQKWWVVTILITAPVVALAAGVPNVFSPNTVISSAQVNANFTNLANRVTALETASPPAPTVTVRTSASTVLPANDFALASASCLSGEVVTGGGCTFLNYAGGLGDQNAVASAPVSSASLSDGNAPPFPSSFTGPTTWTCVYEETQGVSGNTFQAFAVCSAP